MCGASIPKLKTPAPPPPAPVQMAESVAPTPDLKAKRRAGGFGLDLLTIPMDPSMSNQAGINIPGT